MVGIRDAGEIGKNSWSFSSYLFGSEFSGEIDRRMTIDHTRILSDMQCQYTEGIPIERIINDLWYAIQAEIDLLMEYEVNTITEEFMRIIKDSKSSEPTKFRTIHFFEGYFS